MAKSAGTKSPGSVTLRVRIWVHPRDKRIRIVAPDEFITTVADKPGKRFHGPLYKHLRRVLKRRDKWLLG